MAANSSKDFADGNQFTLQTGLRAIHRILILCDATLHTEHLLPHARVQRACTSTCASGRFESCSPTCRPLASHLRLLLKARPQPARSLWLLVQGARLLDMPRSSDMILFGNDDGTRGQNEEDAVALHRHKNEIHVLRWHAEFYAAQPPQGGPWHCHHGLDSHEVPMSFLRSTHHVSAVIQADHPAAFSCYSHRQEPQLH